MSTANYVISGVWFTYNKVISHVMLHPYTNTGIGKGTKTSKDSVVQFLKSNTIRTIKWDYKGGTWHWGALVDSETRNGVTYLRTRADGDVSNNLDNLINLDIYPS